MKKSFRRKKDLSQTAKECNPEKLGTTMWINPQGAVNGQQGKGVQQFAYLMGIVPMHISSTTRMVAGMLTEKYLRTEYLNKISFDGFQFIAASHVLMDVAAI